MSRICRYIDEQGLFSLLCFGLDFFRNLVLTRLLLRTRHRSGIYIGPSAIVRGAKNIKLGPNFFAKDMLWLDAISRYGENRYAPNIMIGARASLSRNVHIAAIEGVFIGDDVLIGSNVLITDHSHGDPRKFFNLERGAVRQYVKRPLFSKGPVVIGNNVWLGDGVVVLAGVSIGDNAVIGSNSVVSRDVPANSVAVGAPARVKTVALLKNLQ